MHTRRNPHVAFSNPGNAHGVTLGFGHGLIKQEPTAPDLPELPEPPLPLGPPSRKPPVVSDPTIPIGSDEEQDK